MEKSIRLDKMTLGTCYYPEHWDVSLWESDLDRMLENGIEVVRIAEFAWNKIEPEEGVFTFEFFDRFLEIAQKKGMKVIFCTPTATPPAWASHNYPEILNAHKNGDLLYHGKRRHYNYNAAKYQMLSDIITKKIGEHYGPHPAIIGWQLDNELNCETPEFYSESDSKAFRTFLRQKYGTIDALNQAWGTVFWNQDYTSWEQVFVPRIEHSNPHQELDYLRFISDSCCRFSERQTKILRKYIKNEDFITTNGLFGNVDNQRQVRENLDFMTYDSYPNFAYGVHGDTRDCGDLKDRKWSRNLTETRAISPIFGIMEQQSGPNGWVGKMAASAPKPGQLTLWSMQSIAHGADFVSYFRWRTCTFGTEIYWHGILDYDNRDNRRLAEVKSVHEKLGKIREVTGAHYQAKVAILKEYDNVWDAQYDTWHSDVENVSQKGLFAAAQRSHTPLDYCYLNSWTTVEDLKKYEVLFYPHATIVKPETAALLTAYAEQGGTLVFGCRTGYKDVHGKCLMMPKPGLLADLCGCDVVEATYANVFEDLMTANWGGTDVHAPMFHDVLQSNGAQVLAAFGASYYKDQPALTCNTVGEGKVYYFGSTFDEQAAYVFLQKLGVITPYADVLELPGSCELAVRAKDGQDYFFVLNYIDGEQTMTLKQPMRNLFTGEVLSGEVVLKAFEVAVLKAE